MTTTTLPFPQRLNRLAAGTLSKKVPPITAFKHMGPEFAGAFAAGSSVQIATFDHYAGMQGDRADPLEGRAINRQGSTDLFWLAKRGDANAIEFMNRMYGPFWQQQPATANIIIHNNELHYVQAPAYIFCASAVVDLDRLASGERVFVIPDLVEFAAQLISSSNQRLLGAAIGPVIYEKRDVNALEDGIRENDPFRKDISMSFENEIRIVFDSSEVLSPTLQLKVPFLPNIITEIFGEFVDRGHAARVTTKIFD